MRKSARAKLFDASLIKTLLATALLGLLTGIVVTYFSRTRFDLALPASFPVINYPRPADWRVVSLTDYKISLCLPPHWETSPHGHIVAQRATDYQPGVADIREFPFNGESLRDEYLRKKLKTNPDLVKAKTQIVSRESVVNGLPILLVTLPGSSETLIFAINNKLYEVSLYAWNLVSNSRETFLKDLYTMLGCAKTI